jgi:hypothetical protein
MLKVASDSVFLNYCNCYIFLKGDFNFKDYITSQGSVSDKQSSVLGLFGPPTILQVLKVDNMQLK